MDTADAMDGDCHDLEEDINDPMLLGRRKSRVNNHGLPIPQRPMSQVGMEGSRHLIPERLPSARRERTVTLRVIDLTPDTLRTIQQLGPALRRLDMSNLYLMDLNEDMLKDLSGLQKLDVSYNELTEEGFPAVCKKLESLTELSAHYNSMSKLPKVLRRLRNLTRLKLGYNSLQSTDGVEKLKRLNVLVLEHNKLDNLGKELLGNLRKLEILHCGCNQLKEIPSDIRHLKYLKDIDISNNRLSILPRELFMLTHLEVVNASGNQISRVPSTLMRRKVTKNRLALVDLSENAVVKFPEHLILVTDKLDLSSNKIKSIQGNLIKKLDLDTDQVLHLYDNPVINPPAYICDCGLKAIMNFYQEGKAYMKVYQGLKVLVLGPSQGGKSSLVQSLVDQQPRLTDSDETSIGVEMYDMSIEMPADEETEETMKMNDQLSDSDSDAEINAKLPRPPPVKSLLLSIWDFSGHPNYLRSHYHFLEQPSLILLVFDLRKYDPETFKDTIGTWLDWVIAKMNKLVVLPVGTHADKLPKSKVNVICGEVSVKLQEYIQNHKISLEREIKRIEGREHISPSLSEQLKLYVNLLKVQCTINERVMAVSSADLRGTEDLLKQIESMALDKETFPEVMRVIPSLWIDVEAFVEDKGDMMEIPIMHWDEYSAIITKKFGMKHLLEQITKYLHDIGKVLWYSDHHNLKDFVIMRPSWLVEIVKAFFRHDLDMLDYSQEDTIKVSSVTQFKFEKVRNEYLETGTVDKELMKCLWATLVPKDLNKPVMEILGMVLEHMEIGYPIKRPKEPKAPATVGKKLERRSSSSSLKSSRSETLTERSEVVSEKPDDIKDMVMENGKPALCPKVSRGVIPWCLQPHPPVQFRTEYEQYLQSPCLAPVYRFPKYLPPGIFESMTVLTLKEKHNFVPIYHWRGGLYAKHSELPIRIYVQRIQHEDKSNCLRLELRHLDKEGEEEQLVDLLWKVFLSYLREVDEMVASFKGARVIRHMECPLCHSLAFFGEWLTPKEFQALSHKKCEMCKNDVNTYYLVQPKEKKRHFWISRIRQLQRERRQALSATSEGEELTEEERTRSDAESGKQTVSPLPT